MTYIFIALAVLYFCLSCFMFYSLLEYSSRKEFSYIIACAGLSLVWPLTIIWYLADANRL